MRTAIQRNFSLIKSKIRRLKFKSFGIALVIFIVVCLSASDIVCFFESEQELSRELNLLDGYCIEKNMLMSTKLNFLIKGKEVEKKTRV